MRGKLIDLHPGDRESSTMMKLYGIVNCDTVKKARAWLDEHRVAYEWVDFRKTPPTQQDLSRWSRAVGWETLVNRRGTSWRKLAPARQAAVRDEASAIAVMQEMPTLIKRPVVERGNEVFVGFDGDDYAKRFRR